MAAGQPGSVAVVALAGTQGQVSLRRALSLRDLVLFGLVTLQLTSPMPIYGALYNSSNGHTVAVVLLSMVAVLLTAIGGLLPPALGLVICAYLWIHLSRNALIAGGLWTVAGIAFGALRTHGFRRDLVTFEAKTEPEGS